jgi:hypothetical protein
MGNSSSAQFLWSRLAMLAEETSPLVLAAILTFRFGLFAMGKAFGVLLFLHLLQIVIGYGHELRIRPGSHRGSDSEVEIEHSYSSRFILLFPAMLCCLFFQYDATTIVSCWIYLVTGFLLHYQRMLGHAGRKGVAVHRAAAVFSIASPLTVYFLLHEFNLFSLLLILSSLDLIQWIIQFLITSRLPALSPRVDFSYLSTYVPYLITSLFQFTFMNALLLFAAVGFDTMTIGVAAWLSLLLRMSIALSGLLISQSGENRQQSDFITESDKGKAIFILTAILNAMLAVLLYHKLQPWLPESFSHPLLLAGLYLLVMLVYLLTQQNFDAGQLRTDLGYPIYRMTHSIMAIQLLGMVLALFAGVSFIWMLWILLFGYALRYSVTLIQFRQLKA